MSVLILVGKDMMVGMNAVANVRTLFVSLFVVFNAVVSAEDAKSVSLAVFEMSPYVYPDREHAGLAIDVANQAFEQVGWRVNFATYPTSRATLNATNGEVDGFLMATTNFTSDNYVYSESFIESRIVFIQSSGRSVAYTNPNDFNGRSLVTIAGWGVEASFPKINWERVARAEQMLLMVKLSRVDAMLYEELAFNYTLSSMDEVDYSDFNVLTPAITPVTYGLAVGVQNERSQEIVDAFNTGLATLQTSGELEKIIQKYRRQ